LKNDVYIVRMNKIAQFLSDCQDVANAISKRKYIPKSQVRKLTDYRLFFQALQFDPVFSRLADHSLRLLHEIIEYVRIYNTLGYIEDLSEKAKQISELLDAYDTLIDEFERRALNGV
jgi:hypothetical protein